MKKKDSNIDKALKVKALKEELVTVIKMLREKGAVTGDNGEAELLVSMKATVYEIIGLNTKQLKELCLFLAGDTMGASAARGELKEREMWVLDNIEEIKKKGVEEDEN